MNRATFVHHAAAFAGAPAVATYASPQPSRPFAVLPRLTPIDASVDHIMRVTVCLRPFRAAGPRIEAERVGDALVIHNYGHGGSGWSLSWGSAALALAKIVEAGAGGTDLAVIGAGAIGLTTALTAQRAGMRVTIYTKERFPYVRSARATGSWTPDSRIALTSAASADFPAIWESMARTSFTMYQSYLGVAGNPVEWSDRYVFSDLTRAEKRAVSQRTNRRGFAEYGDRIADISPDYVDLRTPDGHLPFGVKRAYKTSSMTFNIADYARQLTTEFYAAGGTFETREFRTPVELASLPEKTIVHCTGYAARALWSDESVVPIRGQLAMLVPQDGVRYGLYLDGLGIFGRRDGIVVQPSLGGDDEGWNDDNETPDRATAESGVRRLERFVTRARDAF